MMNHCSADNMHHRMETRLAALNVVLTFMTLTQEKPVALTVDDMLTLAERVECWAWRDLDTMPPSDKAATPLVSPEPSVAPPAAPARSSTPASPLSPAALNCNGDQTQRMSDQQRNAIFSLAKTKGYTAAQMTQWVKGQFHKGIDELQHAEAAKLILHLNVA